MHATVRSMPLPQVIPMTLRLPLLLLAALALALTGCTEGDRAAPAGSDVLAAVKAAKTVRVGVLADNPPFSFQAGGTWTGFDVEIAHGIANHLGIEKVEFVPVALDQRSDSVIAGKVDMVVASMTITRYRERRVDFSIPYFQDGQSLLVKAASPIKSYLDLNGRKVGAVKGSTASFYLKQINPDAVVVTYADNAALGKALENDEIDAATNDQLVLTGMVVSAKDPAAWRIAGERLTAEPYGVAIAQNQSAWRNAINHALLALWETQDWHASADTWFGPASKYASPVNFVMQVYPK
jgi:polar amino acid transport system substrate-binding protein